MKLSNKLSIATASVALSFAAVGVNSAQAAVIYNPTPTVTLNNGSFNTTFGSLANIANGNGLIGSGDILTKQHSAGGSGANFWSAALQNGATANDVNLDFDFGSEVRLDTLALWNYNAFNPTAVQRGIRDFNLIISNNSDFSNPVYTSGVLTLAQGLGTAPINPSIFSFSPVTARYARIDVASNYGTTNAIGLSEVRFAEVQPVPEPTTVGGAIAAGAGLISAKMKQRKKQKASQAA
jgi:hypothetical protein